MKTSYKYLILTVAIGTMLTVTSCKKTFFTDANTNINNPLLVPPSTLLPTVEVSLGYTQGGTFSLFTSLLTQQTQGAARQSAAYYQYIFTDQDFDDTWSNLYTSTMENCVTLQQLSDKNGYNEYAGISRLLLAYTLQITVDCWGKIPYSTAFKGVANLQPSYDDDKTLYGSIGSLVSDGIALLNNSDPGAITPGGDDVIYGGSEAEWIKFGHAINARLAIHQSKNNAAMATTALTEIASSFTSNADNAQVLFISTQTNAAPWFQFNQERGGDVSFTTSTLADTLKANNDPRWLVYVDTSFTDPNQVGMGAYYGSDNSPIELITYDELLADKAEALVITGGANPQAAFDSSIVADMTKLGIGGSAITTYLTANGTLGSSPLTQIAKEDWIAEYLNPEAWVSFRRLGEPNLTPISGGKFPHRFLYPQTEYNYNASNVNAAYGQSVTLYAPKVFWDN